MQRILLSLGMIVFVGALAAGATGAFFSDTETSTGNTFAAGDIDLRIDNTSYVTNNAGVLVASPNNTWTISDLTNQLFFSFSDVKPGDIGEDTISIHPGSNDAYACMAADITATPDNGINEPEGDAGDITDGALAGELQNFINFSFWEDDGDNVFETGEVLLPDLQGTAAQIFDGGWNTIADSGNGPALPGGSTTYVGKAWCFGTLTPNGTAQNGNGTGTPLTLGTTGFTCNGSGENNIAQTDGINVDVSFYAVQARNNGQFLCSGLPVFEGTGGRAVGAALTSYPTPTCNATVSGSQSIQTALNAAAVSSTVCVDSTYDRTGDNVAVRMETTGVKLAALTQGILLDVPVVLSADGVKVTGFEGTIGQAESPAEQAAFYFDNDATNASLTFSEVTGGVGAAVLTETGAANGGGLIENNVFTGAVQGIYLNPHTGSIMVRFNDFVNNVVGIAVLNGALVVANEFRHSGVTQEAIGIDSTFDSNPASATNNNFLNGMQLNDYGAVAVMDAENNFFNLGSAAQIDAGQFDVTPETLVMYPHN